jgi:uncharacterized protein YpbB
MAMYLDTFPLDQFVPSDDIVTIEKLRDPESWALKPIFEKMGNVSYFQIRLVFARLKRGETFV